jgi:hypothetical protein
MNANELADELMKFYNLEENTAPIQIFDLAATMLRQQQAEIEALKYEKSSGVYDLAKTLTDEEIISIADDYEVAEYRVCEFARAILKKASEK